MKMKASGIEWIGKIPEEWNLARIAALYSLRNTKVSDEDYPPLSVTMQGILPQLETAAKTNDHDNRKLVRKGDFAINSRSDRRGSCGISEIDGSVSLINTVLRPNRQMNNRFYNWLFHTSLFSDEFYKWGHGIVDDLWTTNWQDMKKITVPYPPIIDQRRIATFLDTKCAEIDALHANIEKEIATLEEYKKSVITEAVTKGLDPNVEMKESGVEWFPFVPLGWRFGRIKNVIDVLTDYTANGSFGDLAKNVEYHDYEDYARLIRLTDLRENLNNMGVYVNEYAYNYLGKSKLFGGEVLVANVGAYAGLFCEMPTVNMPTSLAPNMFLIRTNEIMDQHFLAYVGNSRFVWEQLSQKAFASAQPKLNKTDVKSVFVPIPPIDEQKAITNFLDTKCIEIEGIITDKKTQLALLDSYKKSVIYEYVTGKKV